MDFAEITKTLTNLMKKYQSLTWDDSCEAAFESLNKALITAPILSQPDYNRPFNVDTDSSSTQLGAVLSNNNDGVERPLVYASRVLSETECQYATTKREALTVVQAAKWFKLSVLGLTLLIRTDHSNPKWLFGQNADGMAFRMLQVLQDFDYEFVHQTGAKHGNADGFSRQVPDEQLTDWQYGELAQLTQPKPEPCRVGKQLKENTRAWLFPSVSFDPARFEEAPLFKLKHYAKHKGVILSSEFSESGRTAKNNQIKYHSLKAL